MTPDISRRCGLSLFFAMSLAVAAGLWALPAFDPLNSLQRLEALRQAPWLAGALHAVLAACAGTLSWLQLARRVNRAWDERPAWVALGLVWVVGLGAWMLGALEDRSGDARGLLWLEMLPLWLAAAGLWGRPAQASRLSGQPERVAQRGPAVGVVNQLDMGTGGNVLGPGSLQHGRGRRENNVVAMTEQAQEQLVA
jgi:hypothetical protein